MMADDSGDQRFGIASCGIEHVEGGERHVAPGVLSKADQKPIRKPALTRSPSLVPDVASW
jgi:hypothetical protein